MSLSSEENSGFARVIAVLRELGKESLLDVFKKNELTDDALDCLETQHDMRNEIKGENISKGVAIKFSKTWFSHKKSGVVGSESVPSTSRQSIPTGIVSECREERNQVQNGGHLKSEDHDNGSVVPEKVGTTGHNERRNISNLKENVSHGPECENVSQEREVKVKSVENDVGGSLVEEKAKSIETTSQRKTIDINNNTVKESDVPNCSSAKCHNKNTHVIKETISNELKERKKQPKSNNTDHCAKSSKKKALANDADGEGQAISNSGAVDRKYCAPRPFGQSAEKFSYENGTAFPNVENHGIEFKALTQEKPQKLPWKIMEKARLFICGVLNAGGQGIIYFGIGDSCDDKTDFIHGEIIGLEVESLKDEISKAFQSILDDHIKSDNGKMTRGGDMNCVKIHFVPVSLVTNQNTGRYIVEIEVKREWKFCKDQVYYVEEWRKRVDDRKPVEKYGLNNLFNVKKEKDEAYIRTCGATQSVKSSDITKDIKEPLSLKYKEWLDENNKKQLRQMPCQDGFDSRQFSSDVHESLRELNSKENDYILVANKTPPEYRGTNSLAFIQAIQWMAVFDLFDQKTKEDGLFYILNKTSDSPPVTKKELGDFKQIEEKTTRGTTWILRNQTMHESLWIHNSKDCLYRAMSSYHEHAPNGRIHCVFLVLSEENLREMADIIDSCVSIIGNSANKCITILSEKKEVGVALTKLLQPEVRKDLKNPCSIFGFPLEFLRKSVEEMLGDVAYEDATATTELPFWNGKFKPILNKRINSLTDLEVYFPKPKLSSSCREVKVARDNFYKGEVIKQLNLDNNDDIERTHATELTQRIDRSLKRLSAESPDDTAYAVIVSLSYESGSGATTLGRRMLWNRRVFYRCAVVKAITENTDHQIQELQRFGYETGQGLVSPVLILVDNFPEHQVNNLRDKLSGRNTRCVLLTTIPIAKKLEKKSHYDCLKLGKLDKEEIQRVKKILANIEDKNEQEKDAAVEKIKREKRFIWLGLELFGRQYNKIRKRLSDHIHDIISHNVTDQLKGAYKMILHFCCLLDYYSKGRSIYPHPCIADILYAHDDLKNDDMNQIEKIHDKFGGLMLEDYSEAEGYHGWRPAHFLVGEVVQEEVDFVHTAKMLVRNMNSGTAFAKTYLINNTVNVFLKREKISESSSQNINDNDFILDGISGEDEFDSLEIQTRYSALVMAAMLNENFPSNVLNALDLLVTLIENVHTTQHKARTWQQIARLFAYEIGMREISEKIEPVVTRINEELSDQSLNCSTASNGFAIAHQVIDHAIEMQKSFVNHLVTKATFFKVKLRGLYEQARDNNAKNEESKEIITEAISTTKKGIQAYDNALESPDGYLHAMVGKLQTIIVLLQIFKTHSCFTQNNEGPDKSFKNYITFGNHPTALKETLTEDDLDYFLRLANKVVQHLNELFGELKLRKRQYEKHEKQELINTKIRAMALREKFYQVTQRDQRHERIVNDTGCREDIVHDLLYVHQETPYSTWKKLPADVIARIYATLKHAISKGEVSHDAMLICARAALEANVTFDDLYQHTQLWNRHFPTSVWCHMFNYMIHFPVPSGALKSNVQVVKQSANFCKNSGSRIRERYRKSGAEYLLGRGIGLNVILSSHKVSPDSVEHKIDFWRSLELYEKLERLRGEKILGKKGVLSYKGIEIMFDNDRYPKESRDELLFFLGFTLNGPYAYDPIDDDTYKRMEDDFQKKKENDASQASASSQESAEERTLKSAWQSNNQGFLMVEQSVFEITTSQPGDQRGEKPNMEATKQSSVKGKIEVPTTEITKYTDHYITEGEFKNNPKLVIRKRTKEGDQKTFTPKWKDQDGKIHHGAFVKGAPKSSECRRHQKNTLGTKSCTFAHSWKEDYVQQTVCDICTKSKRYSCMGKDEHSRYIYELGSYLDESGKTWLPTETKK